jgi:hypothetical protein
MSTIKGLISKLLGAGSQLSAVEKAVLDCVRGQLNAGMVNLWDGQVQAINKIQRLPEGVEVNFYRMKSGCPSFPEELSFPNKAKELLLAKVRIEVPSLQGKLNAKVWCVEGFLFSIEYAGSVSYFEEAAGMDPRPEFKVSCELTADLALASA